MVEVLVVVQDDQTLPLSDRSQDQVPDRYCTMQAGLRKQPHHLGGAIEVGLTGLSQRQSFGHLAPKVLELLPSSRAEKCFQLEYAAARNEIGRNQGRQHS